MSDPETITEAAVERVRSLAQSWASLEGNDVAAEVDSRLGHLILGMLDDAGNAPGGPGARLEAVEALAETWERPGGSLYYPAAGQAVLEALRGASTDVEAGWRERAEAAEGKLAGLRDLVASWRDRAERDGSDLLLHIRAYADALDDCAGQLEAIISTEGDEGRG